MKSFVIKAAVTSRTGLFLLAAAAGVILAILTGPVERYPVNPWSDAGIHPIQPGDEDYEFSQQLGKTKSQ